MLNQGVNAGSTSSPDGMLNWVRNMNRQQWVTAGVIGAEVIGFFTVGEMIGKLKLVGYRGDPQHD